VKTNPESEDDHPENPGKTELYEAPDDVYILFNPWNSSMPLKILTFTTCHYILSHLFCFKAGMRLRSRN
jgi:hypothetical protein